jgi:Fe-S-cluster containining protein
MNHDGDNPDSRPLQTDSPGSAAGRTSLPLIRLDAAPDSNAVVTADIQVTIGGEPKHLAITVPSGPARVEDLLPVFRGLTGVVVDIGIRNVERKGAQVSCRAGCGACCRQPVPVSESEARGLRRLVDNMPEPRRSQIRERFADAVRRLDKSGLLERIRDTPPGEDMVAVGLEYFLLGLACPFLEDESCSIHPDRPIACREYLVTSPAEECARPAEARVRGIPLAAHVGRAVRAIDRPASGARSGCVPLVLALEWTEAHPDEPPPAAGPDLLLAFWSEFVGKSTSPG